MTSGTTTTNPPVPDEHGWLPIEYARRGELLLLYFPAEAGRAAVSATVKVAHHPVHYPRKPTHWQPLPPPPVKP